MKPKIAKLVRDCKIRKESKYNRDRPNLELKETAIPEYRGHVLHIAIYSIERHQVLTAIDKFSKEIIESKATEVVRIPLRNIVFYFGVPKHIYINYQPAQVVFVKVNTRLGSKLSSRFRKEVEK